MENSAASSSAVSNSLRSRLRLPMFGAPMFLVSSPALVTEQCKAGIVGVLPCLNLRPSQAFNEALVQICADLRQWDEQNPNAKAAPLAVNLMVHPSNARLEEDLAIICEQRVEIVITSLNPPPAHVLERIRAYGGLVFHDVSHVRHARKAIAAGIDGLVLVCAGSGGHTGRLSPFAFVREVREVFAGPICVGGAINSGEHLLAVQAAGADFGYCGSAFIASQEASAGDVYKQLVVESKADDIVLSTAVTGLLGSYLKKSFERLGLDPDALQDRKTNSFDLALTPEGTKAKAWKDVWSAGQGVGATPAVQPAAEIVSRYAQQYEAARQRIHALTAPSHAAAV